MSHVAHMSLVALHTSHVTRHTSPGNVGKTKKDARASMGTGTSESAAAAAASTAAAAAAAASSNPASATPLKASRGAPSSNDLGPMSALDAAALELQVSARAGGDAHDLSACVCVCVCALRCKCCRVCAHCGVGRLGGIDSSFGVHHAALSISHVPKITLMPLCFAAHELERHKSSFG